MKTYTLTAISVKQYTSVVRGLLTDGTSCNKVEFTSNNYVGHASQYRAVMFEFDHTTIAHLRGLSSGSISSITLKIPITDKRGEYIKTYYGTCKSTSDTHCYVDSPTYVQLTGGAGTTFEIDLKSIGIPATSYAYAIGGTSAAQSSDYYKVVGTAQLVVVTNENTYTVTYNANGGTGAPGSQTVTGSGSSVSVHLSSVVPTYSGRTFLGWSETKTATSAQYAAGATISISKNTTLYAVWRINDYNITYRYGSETITDKKQYNVSIKLRGSTTFTRKGYGLIGWATSSGGAKAYNLNATYSTNASLTLYPVWAALLIIVKFDPAGGQCATTERSFIYGEELDLPDPTRYGFTFLGWYTAEHGGTRINEGDPSPFYKVGTTLYAHWEAQPSTGKHRLIAYIKEDDMMKRAFVYVGDDDPTPRRGYIL